MAYEVSEYLTGGNQNNPYESQQTPEYQTAQQNNNLSGATASAQMNQNISSTLSGIGSYTFPGFPSSGVAQPYTPTGSPWYLASGAQGEFGEGGLASYLEGSPRYEPEATIYAAGAGTKPGTGTTAGSGKGGTGTGEVILWKSPPSTDPDGMTSSIVYKNGKWYRVLNGGIQGYVNEYQEIMPEELANIKKWLEKEGIKWWEMIGGGSTPTSGTTEPKPPTPTTMFNIASSATEGDATDIIKSPLSAWEDNLSGGKLSQVVGTDPKGGSTFQAATQYPIDETVPTSAQDYKWLSDIYADTTLITGTSKDGKPEYDQKKLTDTLKKAWNEQYKSLKFGEWVTVAVPKGTGDADGTVKYVWKDPTTGDIQTGTKPPEGYKNYTEREYWKDKEDSLTKLITDQWNNKHYFQGISTLDSAAQAEVVKYYDQLREVQEKLQGLQNMRPGERAAEEDRTGISLMAYIKQMNDLQDLIVPYKEKVRGTAANLEQGEDLAGQSDIYSRASGRTLSPEQQAYEQRNFDFRRMKDLLYQPGQTAPATPEQIQNSLALTVLQGGMGSPAVQAQLQQYGISGSVPSATPPSGLGGEEYNPTDPQWAQKYQSFYIQGYNMPVITRKSDNAMWNPSTRQWEQNPYTGKTGYTGTASAATTAATATPTTGTTGTTATTATPTTGTTATPATGAPQPTLQEAMANPNKYSVVPGFAGGWIITDKATGQIWYIPPGTGSLPPSGIGKGKPGTEPPTGTKPPTKFPPIGATTAGQPTLQEAMANPNQYAVSSGFAGGWIITDKSTGQIWYIPPGYGQLPPSTVPSGTNKGKPFSLGASLI